MYLPKTSYRDGLLPVSCYQTPQTESGHSLCVPLPKTSYREQSLPLCSTKDLIQRHSLCPVTKDLIQRIVTPCVSLLPKTSYRERSLPLCLQRPHTETLPVSCFQRLQTETGHSLCVSTKDLIQRPVTPSVSLPKTSYRDRSLSACFLPKTSYRDRSLPACHYQRPHTETSHSLCVSTTKDFIQRLVTKVKTTWPVLGSPPFIWFKNVY